MKILPDFKIAAVDLDAVSRRRFAPSVRKTDEISCASEFRGGHTEFDRVATADAPWVEVDQPDLLLLAVKGRIDVCHGLPQQTRRAREL